MTSWLFPKCLLQCHVEVKYCLTGFNGNWQNYYNVRFTQLLYEQRNSCMRPALQVTISIRKSPNSPHENERSWDKYLNSVLNIKENTMLFHPKYHLINLFHSETHTKYRNTLCGKNAVTDCYSRWYIYLPQDFKELSYSSKVVRACWVYLLKRTTPFITAVEKLTPGRKGLTYMTMH
jgi:hypothetical protein